MSNVSRLSGTVSLVHNNLTCSSTGTAASVHDSVSGGGRILFNKGTSSTDGPAATQVTSIRYLELPSGPVLAVSSTNGTQIYNEDASAMLVFVPTSGPSNNPDTLNCHQGACFVPPAQHIAIGTSKGSLMLVNTATAPSFMALPESVPSADSTGVADVCFNQLMNTVVSAHRNGELRIWALTASGPYENQAVVPVTGQVPVRVASLGARLLVAYGPGTVCLFDAATYGLQVELTAHARWLTAVDVREEVGLVATVGEDTVLNVWQVDPGTGQVHLQHSSVVTDKLLTGVAMHGAEALVAAYDSSELCRVALPF